MVLVALVVLLALAVVGCDASGTTTPGSMMGSPASGGRMMYGTSVGPMMGSSTSVLMMGGQTTAP